MVQFVPINANQHKEKGWQRFQNYGFAETEAVIPIVAAELGKAVLSMPLGFIKDAQEHFLLVGIMSLQSGMNLFVAPDGRWLGGYVPAALRAHPFRLLRQDGTDRQVLCIDTDSQLLVDEPSSPDQRFFNDDGELMPSLKEVMEFLKMIEQSRLLTQAAVAKIAELDLLETWPVSLKAGEKSVPVQGLYRVNETAFNRLDSESFEQLRSVGGLPVVYAQLFAQGQLGLLEKLTQIRQQLSQQRADAPRMNGEVVEELFGAKDDTIRFNF